MKIQQKTQGGNNYAIDKNRLLTKKNNNMLSRPQDTLQMVRTENQWVDKKTIKL